MPAQTRSNWNIGENKAGQQGSHDPAASDFTERVKATIPFGRFVIRDASTKDMRVPTAGDLKLHGISLEDPQASSDQENQQYLVNDIGAFAKRGNYFVAIDPDDKPVVNGAVIVSLEGGQEGKLSSLVAGNIEGLEEHIRIVAVYDTVAEVYIDGAAEHTGTLGS